MEKRESDLQHIRITEIHPIVRSCILQNVTSVHHFIFEIIILIMYSSSTVK